MNCHEVREGLAASSRGGMGLTEWALVHAHVSHCVDCRKERESLQPGVSSRQRVALSRGASDFAASLTRLHVRASISLTGSGQTAVRMIAAARAGVARVVGLPTRLRGLLSPLVAPSAQAAASVIGHVRLVGRRVAHLLIRLRQGVARAAIEATGRVISAGRIGAVRILAARAGVARVVGLPTRVRGLLPPLVAPAAQAAASVIGHVRFMGPRGAHLLIRLRQGVARAALEATGRVISAGRIGAARILDLLMPAIGRVWDVGRILVTTSGRALTLLGARTSAWTRTRPLLRVSTGIVSLTVLVAAIVFLWPPRWPDRLVERKPAELLVTAPVTRTSAPVAVSPVGESRPETRRTTVRPRPPEAQAGIPAPFRRSDRALAQSRAPATGPMPSMEATQTAETSDPAAAIDWLLNGGSSRRPTQSP